MSTFELQASICAALNSKHHMIICIGVDSFNTVTGIEMNATDRVIFRMALTRAVAGEFQPPLVKVSKQPPKLSSHAHVQIPPKQLTGVSPMKRDVSELTPSIDVLFVPVIGAPVVDSESSSLGRFLIVVRVKELSEKLYQLSSGRIYVEEDGRVVEMPCFDKAFRSLIVEKDPEHEPPIGSLFMLEPEPFIEDSLLEVEECSSDDNENDEYVVVSQKSEVKQSAKPQQPEKPSTKVAEPVAE